MPLTTALESAGLIHWWLARAVAFTEPLEFVISCLFAASCDTERDTSAWAPPLTLSCNAPIVLVELEVVELDVLEEVVDVVVELIGIVVVVVEEFIGMVEVDGAVLLVDEFVGGTVVVDVVVEVELELTLPKYSVAWLLGGVRVVEPSAVKNNRHASSIAKSDRGKPMKVPAACADSTAVWLRLGVFDDAAIVSFCTDAGFMPYCRGFNSFVIPPRSKWGTNREITAIARTIIPDRPALPP